MTGIPASAQQPDAAIAPSSESSGKDEPVSAAPASNMTPNQHSSGASGAQSREEIATKLNMGGGATINTKGTGAGASG